MRGNLARSASQALVKYL